MNGFERWPRPQQDEPKKKEPLFSPVEAAALLFEVGRFGYGLFRSQREERLRVEHAVLHLADQRRGCLSPLDVVSATEVSLVDVQACLDRLAAEGHCRRERDDVYVFGRFLPRFCEYCGEPLPREWDLARTGACEGCGADD